MIQINITTKQNNGKEFITTYNNKFNAMLAIVNEVKLEVLKHPDQIVNVSLVDDSDITTEFLNELKNYLSKRYYFRMLLDNKLHYLNGSV